MKRLLADESVDFRIVKALRENDFEVDAIIEISFGITDEEVLKLANELEAVLITSDKDFGELTYRLKKSSFGIILLRFQNIKIEQQIELVLEILDKYESELEYKFTVVTNDKIRIKNIES
jgi:predicted nuclease of predicted toxin-antitoxin system